MTVKKNGNTSPSIVHRLKGRMKIVATGCVLLKLKRGPTHHWLIHCITWCRHACLSHSIPFYTLLD